MSMSMSMAMPTSTGAAMSSMAMTSGSAMPSMSSMSGMSGMSGSMMSDGMPMMMSMQDMYNVFYTATNTALFSMAWQPTTVGQYAGTCIFLIVFGTLFRAILAVRTNFPAILARLSRHSGADILRSDDEKDGHPSSTHKTEHTWSTKWNVNESLIRAALDTVLAGVSYLLMLAVMTMNVGYFLSVLAGTFLGSFIFGNWTGTASH